MSSSQGSSSALLCAITITLALCYFNTMAVQAAPVEAPLTLEPPHYLSVSVNKMANFTCVLSCQHENTHTIRWLVGQEKFRLLVKGRENSFMKRTGITVSIDETEDTCGMDGGKVRQTLRINVDSVDLNKTTVQCDGAPRTRSYTNIYSRYSVLIVNDPNPAPTVEEPSNDCRQTLKENEVTSESQPTATPLPAGMSTDSGSSFLSPLLLLQLTLIGLIAQYVSYL